jgi:hypothetical protein
MFANDLLVANKVEETGNHNDSQSIFHQCIRNIPSLSFAANMLLSSIHSEMFEGELDGNYLRSFIQFHKHLNIFACIIPKFPLLKIFMHVFSGTNSLNYALIYICMYSSIYACIHLYMFIFMQKWI